uniref:Uncharacterized protein n=1 Tax=Avena sativa TaxID=4498 RepID=A0ACD5TCI0_AVESA
MAILEAGVEKPHALIFPFPAQGHIKPTLQFAKLLHHYHGFQVTFVHTEHNRRRLLRSRGPDALEGVPGFRFVAVPDGLPPSELDASQDLAALLSAMDSLGPHFRKLVSDLPPVSCVVSDIWHVLYTAKDMAFPCVTLWTGNACGFMACQQCQELVDIGIVPLKDAEQLSNGYLDKTVLDWVPGMPKDIRLSDFPSYIRTADSEDPILEILLRSMACHRTTPSAVILHTFDELERETIAAMSAILPPIYAVGPLPLLLGQVPGNTVDTSLSKENHACLEWLEGKRPGSVVYVSFGSLATLTSEQLVEFAWGLASSEKEFLWVIRNDQVSNGAGGDHPAATAVLPPEFFEETKGRGHVTSWCPQEAVLRHEAVGAFLTHCGWNSVLESITAGVPMLCWPFGADQFTNRRYVCTEWRIGLEISSNVDRNGVKAAVLEMMDGDKGKEMKRMVMELKEKAAMAALPGGPSWENLKKLVNEVLTVSPVKRCTEI